MKKFILLLMLLFCPMVYGDEVVHNYFQNLIDEGHNNLATLMANEKSEPLSANAFNVSKDLKKYNINNNALVEIAPSFEIFYDSINNITINYNKMIGYRNISNSSNYLVFKVSLEDLKNNLQVLNDSITKIDKITLEDKNGNTLKFDTSKIKKDIEILSKNIDIYSEKMIPLAPEGFVIYSDENTVFINSNITIHGYGSTDSTSIKLYYNNMSYEVEVENRSFSKTFLIDNLGNNIFYAKYDNKTSNILKIECIKIPTYLRVKYNSEEYIGNDAKIDIHLYDYYGNEINDTVYISYLNRSLKLKSPAMLHINSDKDDKIKVNIKYPGNSIYKGIEKNIPIDFVRIPTYLSSEYCGYNRINGSLLDEFGNPLDNKEIYLIVGNETYTTKTKNGAFEFSLDSKIKGFRNGYNDNECLILFKGDELYAPSSKRLLKEKSFVGFFSNRGGKNNNIWLLSISLILFVIAGFIKRGYKRGNTIVDSINNNTFETIKKEIVDIYPMFVSLITNKKYVEGIIKAYCMFISKLNAHKSLTPREICNRYGNIKGIETITEIFEKVYYGNKSPEKDDINKYDEFFKRSL
ncbi:MAG: hypothetical protein PWP15_79 [Methanothermococcus sp.]|uniref:hypothetical protein n=1 Tax=Methanothermococcus sp. TaxID=2614238 RepID=UPI0025894348|nr:hypothetical protein [Methanothermococcus sp.]MDK2789572.1 hypothetical protein [Methanothermococcus sp.]